MPKLILDVMGGDHAPHATLEGASRAWPRLEARGAELILLGDEKTIHTELRKHRALSRGLKSGKITVLHANENIDMEDSIRAIRSKPGATINIGCRLAGEAYRNAEGATAFVSAGHSGAMMASALLNMGRLPHVERPAIAARVPTLSPDGCVIVDAGANVDCKPEHLRDFAIMGSLFAQVGRKGPGLPKVGVLSNGEERKKGTDLTRGARDLLERNPAFALGAADRVGDFKGYCEGKEIFKGLIDVVVTDGFVGNVMLKTVEGLGSAIATLIKKEAKRGVLTPLGFVVAAAGFRRIHKTLDWAEYGGAPLLGVAGYAFICHGRSNAKSIMNSLLNAYTALEGRLIDRLEDALAHAQQQKQQSEQTAQAAPPARSGEGAELDH